MSISSPLTAIALASAAVAVLILIWFLVRRPTLAGPTKILLLLGLGVFPIATAATGNVSGYEATKQRTFCGSCHVMKPWTEDSEDPDSKTLAARHARNPMFGDENCYMCHADYGKLGAVTTKIGGMRHVYEYLLGGYREMTREQAVDAIHIRRPFPNTNCMQCHSTRATAWTEQSDHAQMIDEIRRGEVSCASAGCHGPAHPFSHGGTP
jgi:nitrate/TMAO reductase-like tetraheme cytochrome c subunit